MKITIDRESNYYTFNQLAIGELFLNPRQDKVYMKIATTRGSNAVRLDTGGVPTFAPDDFVIPVDGELNIKRKDVRS